MGLIRLMMFIVAGALIYLVASKIFRIGIGRSGENPTVEDERLGRLVQDPNCQIYVDSKEAVRQKVPDGELFFCSKKCAEEYMEKSRQGG